jgi:hypothetical protein
MARVGSENDSSQIVELLRGFPDSTGGNRGPLLTNAKGLDRIYHRREYTHALRCLLWTLCCTQHVARGLPLKGNGAGESYRNTVKALGCPAVAVASRIEFQA